MKELAMGGELTLIAKFPDHEPVMLSRLSTLETTSRGVPLLTRHRSLRAHAAQSLTPLRAVGKSFLRRGGYIQMVSSSRNDMCSDSPKTVEPTEALFGILFGRGPPNPGDFSGGKG